MKPYPRKFNEIPIGAAHSTAQLIVDVALILTKCCESFRPQHDAEVQFVVSSPGLMGALGTSSPAQNFFPALSASSNSHG